MKQTTKSEVLVLLVFLATIPAGFATDRTTTSTRCVDIATSHESNGDRIEIDGIFAGSSPLSTELAFGSHTVVAVRDGKRASKSVNVEQGQSEIAVTLGFGQQPQFASSVTSSQRQVLGQLVADMVKVEGGTFTMGATSEQGNDAYNNEKPTHNVTLSDFYIGKYEVTQAQWQAVMGKSVSQIASENNWNTYGVGDNYPMYDISYNDCQEFIRKLNQLTGLNFRLPTEAEWEYAARGGKKSRGYKYAGGNDIGSVAWYNDNSGSKTHPVGTRQANELGPYDMSGNVLEWCQDWYGAYSSSSQTNPTGSYSGSNRVLLGGSWFSVARDCRVSYRNYYAPDNRDDFLGLRLALSHS